MLPYTWPGLFKANCKIYLTANSRMRGGFDNKCDQKPEILRIAEVFPVTLTPYPVTISAF
jgi:hypothetical protein